MNLHTEQINPATIIMSISGRFDAHNVEKVKAVWANNTELTHIIIDLSGATFIDSLGLAGLVSGLKTTTQRKGRFAVCNPSESVRVILGLTGMNRAFQVYATPDKALEALNITRSASDEKPSEKTEKPEIPATSKTKPADVPPSPKPNKEL